VNGDAGTAENLLVLVDEIERRAYGDDRHLAVVSVY
jgi:hypothetical protein